MKITLEFEHPCELIDLLEKFTQCYVLPAAKTNLVEDDYCTLAGSEHELCNAPNCKG